MFQKRHFCQNQQSKSMERVNKVQLSRISKLLPRKLRNQMLRTLLGSLKKLQKKRARKNNKHLLKIRNKIKIHPNNLKHRNKRKKIVPKCFNKRRLYLQPNKRKHLQKNLASPTTNFWKHNKCSKLKTWKYNMKRKSNCNRRKKLN